ncbi:Aste57867_16779 [Aphanomyces stellatus]|uniref:Aste57867_16779 protein n=1 Tax=Aphanomyces stellatus TaxID=120398 RepID=A0A485L756_9STRA|nr:hypothetical protein As57867_016722 [Aphanomyces stellatus]VFT93544.1 Aste57867_16779 [Aphanomyces stellatus]
MFIGLVTLVAAAVVSVVRGQNTDVTTALACQNRSKPYLATLHVGEFAASSYFDCFRPQEQMFEYLDAMMGLAPNKSMTKFNMSTTFQGRPVPAYKISIGSKKSSILVLSLHHAREWISGAATVYTIATLLDSIANNMTQMMLYDWVFVPIVNLDGYIVTWTTQERLRRKNMNPTGGDIPYDPTGGLSQSGVDLNRNYGPLAYFNLEPSTKANLTYPGETPFSEPETSGIHKWLQTHPEVIGSMDIHSYAGAILLPFGDARASPAAPFAAKFDALGSAMQAAIVRDLGVRYDYGPSTMLYMAYGTFTDYFFRHYGKPTVTMEVKGTSFVVPASSITNSGDHVVAGCRAFAQNIAPFVAGLPASTPMAPDTAPAAKPSIGTLPLCALWTAVVTLLL